MFCALLNPRPRELVQRAEEISTRELLQCEDEASLNHPLSSPGPGDDSFDGGGWNASRFASRNDSNLPLLQQPRFKPVEFGAEISRLDIGDGHR